MLDVLANLSLMEVQSEVELYKNIIVFCLGIIVHVLNKMWIDKVTFREYILEHKVRSMLSLGSLSGIFAVIMTAYPDSPLIVYFLCGYSVDNFMNKAPLTARKVQEENIT